MQVITYRVTISRIYQGQYISAIHTHIFISSMQFLHCSLLEWIRKLNKLVMLPVLSRVIKQKLAGYTGISYEQGKWLICIKGI